MDLFLTKIDTMIRDIIFSKNMYLSELVAISQWLPKDNGRYKNYH